MLFETLQLLAGRRHQVHALVLMRGETFIETIEDGGAAVFVLARGSATISRRREGTNAALHMTPRAGEPVWLTTAGTYCVTAREPVIGLRMIRIGASTTSNV